MLWLIPIWFCLALILVGCGLLVCRLLFKLGGAAFSAPLTTFQALWFGYAFCILFLEAYSLALPIRWPTVAALGSLAAAGFWVQRGAVRARVRSLRARPRWTLTLALIAAVVLALVAVRAAHPVTWYDTHLYHLQVVKWARTYPAVPGIANLHYRLAYNNSIHLFGALADVFWKARASHVALGFLSSVVAIQLIVQLLRPAHAQGRLRAAYCLLVLPFVLGRIASNEVPSLSSDLPLNLLCIVIVLELLGQERRGKDASLALALALASVATTTKLGGAAALVTCALTVGHRLWRRGWPRPQLVAFGVLPALVLTAYLARQSILSGWLLFPSPIGNLHLPWSLPAEPALDQFRWIQSWARLPRLEPADVLDQGFARWFYPWFARFAGSHECAVLVFAAAIALYRLAQPRRAQLAWQLPALAAAALSLLIWFHGAPDLRFGAGFFWILLAVVSAPELALAMKERSGRLLAVVLSLALAYWTDGLSLTLPDPAYRVSLPPVKKPKLRELEVSPGLKVLTTMSQDEDLCGNEPLPCTPYPAQQKLRRPNDLSSGFVY